VKLDTSSPAQKALPSPASTTARSPFIVLSSSPAAMIASNCSGSSAFILSGRLKRTQATPSTTS